MLKKVTNFLVEFSIPLISGIILSLLIANTNYEAYQELIKKPIIPHWSIFGHTVNLKFLINDIFMVFFFGIATVEITQAFQKGGAMYPFQKSLNAIAATLGGVLIPILFFFIFCQLFQVEKPVYRGWGISTATDIAIAWLFARFCFGPKHTIISFLLLIAILDDAIGLLIIAIGYPNPDHLIQPQWLSLLVLAVVFCYTIRKLGVRNFIWYICIGGTLSWIGLLKTGLHPSLSLVIIVPFLPSDTQTIQHTRIFEDEKKDYSPMAKFEHLFEPIVCIGLFGFGIVNTAVQFNSFSTVSIIIFLSLFIGKTIGIFTFSYFAHKIGLRLPSNVNYKILLLASMIAGIGLTVAIFMSTVAYIDIAIQNSAKLGALFSVFIGLFAFILSKILKIKKMN